MTWQLHQQAPSGPWDVSFPAPQICTYSASWRGHILALFLQQERFCSPQPHREVQRPKRHGNSDCQWRSTWRTVWESQLSPCLEAISPFSFERVHSSLSLSSDQSTYWIRCYFSTSLAELIFTCALASLIHLHVQMAYLYSSQTTCLSFHCLYFSFIAPIFTSRSLLSHASSFLPALLADGEFLCSQNSILKEMPAFFLPMSPRRLSQAISFNTFLNSRKFPLLKFKVLTLFLSRPMFLKVTNPTRARSRQSGLPPTLISLMISALRSPGED